MRNNSRVELGELYRVNASDLPPAKHILGAI
jgi:hypothetical protein